MHKQLSIIIVTYNSKSIISDCLLSISNFNDIGDSLEVIVVDNNSNDQQEVYEIIQLYKDLQIEWIPNPNNSGYGAGNNIGVQNAKAPHFLIMNPDVRLITPVFKELLALFHTQKDLAMVGVKFADNSLALHIKPEHYTVCRYLLIKVLQKFRFLPFKYLYMSGSFLLFDKVDFLSVGGFDEQFFLYFEEPDITNRLQNNAKNAFLAKDIMVYHLAHQREYNPTLLNAELDSLEYYMKKYNIAHNKLVMKYLIVNYIKYFVSLVFHNQLKKAIFAGWINQLKQRLV